MGLRITAITNLFPTPWEPLRAAFNRQQLSLLGEKHTIEILVPIEWRTWFFCQKDARFVGISSVSTKYFLFLYMPKYCRFLHGLSLFVSMLFQCVRDLRKDKPDCIFAIWAFPDAVAGTLIAKVLKIPVVVKVHGNDINIMTKNYMRRWQILWAMSNAKAIIAVSKALKNRLIFLGVPHEKIYVIYNGINFKSFYPFPVEKAKSLLGLKFHRNILLYVGNLKESKGCVELIRAFATLATEHADLDLYFVGEGEASQAIKLLVDEQSLEGRVALLGALTHEQLSFWYNAASLVCLPSHNEGVPNVLLEAMACGKPVVATNVGGIPEVVPSFAGILVPSCDNKALQKAIDAALSKKWDSVRILKHAQTFQWDSNVEQVSDILQQAVS